MIIKNIERFDSKNDLPDIDSLANPINEMLNMHVAYTALSH